MQLKLDQKGAQGAIKKWFFDLLWIEGTLGVKNVTRCEKPALRVR